MNSPVARQPCFTCSQCTCWFFKRDELKNHIRAKHYTSNYKTSQSQSPPAHGPHYQQYHDEEQLSPPCSPFVDIHDVKCVNLSSPAETENLQGTVNGDTPMIDDYIYYNNYNDHDHYGFQDKNNKFNYDPGSSASCSSTPISVPCSQHHECRTHAHQQKPADDKCLRKTYHSQLNSESLLRFQISLYLF